MATTAGGLTGRAEDLGVGPRVVIDLDRCRVRLAPDGWYSQVGSYEEETRSHGPHTAETRAAYEEAIRALEERPRILGREYPTERNRVADLAVDLLERIEAALAPLGALDGADTPRPASRPPGLSNALGEHSRRLAAGD